GRLAIAYGNAGGGGFGAEIAAAVAYELHNRLLAPIQRVAASPWQIAAAIAAACEVSLELDRPAMAAATAPRLEHRL
ncbi:hypothetical protein, partial [Reyranella sp.]|uniref:hypothetical protein n=1 Tax=Reyranella sp. TaxID=1929291 RepID=UPI002F921AB4